MKHYYLALAVTIFFLWIASELPGVRSEDPRAAGKLKQMAKNCTLVTPHDDYGGKCVDWTTCCKAPPKYGSTRCRAHGKYYWERKQRGKCEYVKEDLDHGWIEYLDLGEHTRRREGEGCYWKTDCISKRCLYVNGKYVCGSDQREWKYQIPPHYTPIYE